MDFLNTPEDITIRNPITNYLENNLKRVEAETEKIQKTIQFLLEQSEEVFEEVADKSDGANIILISQKLLCEKYAIWFQVKNKTEGFLHHFNFCLHWNSGDTLSYTSSMHLVVKPDTNLNSPLVYLDKLEDEALLVVVLDRPIYKTELSIKINGFLSYCDEEGTSYVDEVPEVLISTEDINDAQVNLSPIQEDLNLINFHSRLVCTWKVDLIIELTENEQIAEVLRNGNLTTLGALENMPQRFFTICGKSPLFDGTILEVTDTRNQISDISVYTKDEKSLLAFVHYLYQKINPVILLPAEYKLRVPSSTKTASELQKCISKEMHLIKSSVTKDMSQLDYKNMRKELTTLEYETDLAYLAHIVGEDREELVSADEKQSN